MFSSLGIFNLVALSLGAGASLIIDLFLITSLKHHRFSKYEFKALRRLLVISFLGAVVGGLTEIALLSYSFSLGIIDNEFSFMMLVLLFVVVVISSITIRNIHLRVLERYQQKHNHLSDNFTEHSPGLAQTAIISLITWTTIICVKAYVLYGNIFSYKLNFDPIYFVILYLITIVVAPFLAKHFKRLHR